MSWSQPWDSSRLARPHGRAPQPQMPGACRLRGPTMGAGRFGAPVHHLARCHVGRRRRIQRTAALGRVKSRHCCGGRGTPAGPGASCRSLPPSVRGSAPLPAASRFVPPVPTQPAGGSRRRGRSLAPPCRSAWPRAPLPLQRNSPRPRHNGRSASAAILPAVVAMFAAPDGPDYKLSGRWAARLTLRPG